jgi:hypothetical protein
VSTHRDSLPAGQRDAYERAITAAGAVYATASREKARLAATQGLGAVAGAAWYPDHAFRSPEVLLAELERRYPAQARAA